MNRNKSVRIGNGKAINCGKAGRAKVCKVRSWKETQASGLRMLERHEAERRAAAKLK